MENAFFFFTEDLRSFVKFEAELELIDIDFFVGSDREGKRQDSY